MLSLFRRPPPALPVDRIVSLGGLCEVAFQSRRLARSDRANPFDWWITPLDSVAKVLEAGPAAVLAPDQIVTLSDYGGKPALYSRLAGTVHLHEFPAGEDFLSLDAQAVSDRLAPKHDALFRRMKAACGTGTTLFVRQRLDGHDPSGDALEASLDRLHGLLAGFACEWRLLLLDYPPVAARPWLIAAQVPVHRDHSDLGSVRGWDAVFAAHDIACRASGSRFRYDDLTSTFPRKGFLARLRSNRAGARQR